MLSFLRGIPNGLRSLANDVENHAPKDNIQFHLDGLVNDSAQLNAEMEVEVDPAVWASLQEVARQLCILSETEDEDATFGRPSYFLPPDIIKAHLHLGHTDGNIAHLFSVSERTIRRRMAQYGIR